MGLSTDHATTTDLCHLTKLPAAALLCELVNDDLQGSMARRDDCRVFADKWGLKMISIEQLVQYRRTLEGAITNGVNGHSH
jgi:3,4-dihydroxy-2-butanone 4-phosphate synthase